VNAGEANAQAAVLPTEEKPAAVAASAIANHMVISPATRSIRWSRLKALAGERFREKEMKGPRAMGDSAKQ